MEVSFGWRGDKMGLERLAFSENEINECDNYVFSFLL